MQNSDDPIPISSRYFEGLRRISEAHAKVLFKDKVEENDARAATMILEESLKLTCKFRQQGSNINLIQNPLSKAGKKETLVDILFKANELEENAWKDLAKIEGIDSNEFKILVGTLLNEHRIYRYSFAPDTYRLASRGGQ